MKGSINLSRGNARESPRGNGSRARSASLASRYLERNFIVLLASEALLGHGLDVECDRERTRRLAYELCLPRATSVGICLLR